jgi:purine-nucleoside/S-methyl-5'-thioadenosine phosphorylase / adenosine deaminase
VSAAVERANDGLPQPIEVELTGAHVAFSTRAGGVSDGPYRSLNLGVNTNDDPARVVENHGRLAQAVGLAPGAIALGWQVHGKVLADWSAPPGRAEPLAAGGELARVDGHVTDLEGLGLLVLAADCLPVALAAPGRVAMLHCGWRGLAAGILKGAIARFDEPPAAVIGPGIGRCCYEVGPEVLASFENLDGVARGPMLDLRAVARRLLEAAGVTRVEDVDLCTSCHPELFFSHRRDRGVTGRQAGVVWRSE